MKISRIAIEQASDEQLLALRDNIFLEGWKHIDEDDIRISYDTLLGVLGVHMGDMLYIGIERDGHTHT